MRIYTLEEKLLAITGILLILSLPIGSTFLLTLALTLFIVMIAVNMRRLFGKNMVINIERDSDYLVKESLKNKKYVKAVITFISLPMVGVGVLYLVIQLIVMWVQVFK